MLKSDKGFTLMELMVVVGIIAILAAFSAPLIHEWTKNARYREVARDISYTLQQGRSYSVSQNLQYRFQLRVADNNYRLQRGNRPAASNEWEDVIEWKDISDGVAIRREDACDSSDDSDIVFYPNGTVTAVTATPDDIDEICIMAMGDPLIETHKVSIPSPLTGRVFVDAD